MLPVLQGLACIPNPAQFGSRSVIFNCGQAAPASGGGGAPIFAAPGGGNATAPSPVGSGAGAALVSGAVIGAALLIAAAQLNLKI